MGIARAILLSTLMAIAVFGGTAGQAQDTSQGWTAQQQQAFYTTSQGSRIMPLAWFQALNRADKNEPFAADGLSRYGYLPNPQPTTNPHGLPVGFTVDDRGASPQIGMTCAACHTSEIEYQGRTRRIDGGRGQADFQAFLSDLTASARATINSKPRFDAFAVRVLGSTASANQTIALRSDFTKWVKVFGDFMDRSLPHGNATSWGPGRLDAFGMIFNRVAGLDLNEWGPLNIRVADAPARYPFLWDVRRQDLTQWPGAAPNGLYIQGLVRNIGEVLGVFADFSPKRTLIPGDIRHTNSVDMAGLQNLEELLDKLRSPKWPTDWSALDPDKKARGAALFATNCASCHAARPSLRNPSLWETPIQDVGTDSRLATRAKLREAKTGILRKTSPLFPLLPLLDEQEKVTDILRNVIVGIVLEAALKELLDGDDPLRGGVWRAIEKDLPGLGQERSPLLTEVQRQGLLLTLKRRLEETYIQQTSQATPRAYEARVLGGIWAVAPYMHNGSIPNLWEVLLPPERRSRRFMVGSREFDPKLVGFATDRSPFNATFVVDINQGNDNAGHDYTKGLSDDQRWDLLEFLKSL